MLVVGIFLTNFCFSDEFLSNQIIKSNLIIFILSVIFIHFSNVFALDSLKISSSLNCRLPGPQWRMRSHIVLEYNNENMRFLSPSLNQSNRLYFCSDDINS